MSARIDAKRFEDKAFVLSYFEGVESGNDVTQRLMQDNVTISAPDLICRLVGWLAEVDDSDEDTKERTSQEMKALDLDSQAAASSGSGSESSSSSSSQESSAPQVEGEVSSGGQTSKGFQLGKPSE